MQPAVIPVIEKLHKAGKGIIGMKLIGNGKFKNDSEKIDESLLNMFLDLEQSI